MQVMANKLKVGDVMISPMCGEMVERVTERVGYTEFAKVVVLFKHTNRPLIIHPNQRVEIQERK
jgi:hypothetical protein